MISYRQSSFYSWINKLFECFIVYIFLRDLSYSYLPFDPYIFDSVGIYFGSLFTGWNLLLSIVIIAFSLWWQWQESLHGINSHVLHEWLRSIMCYYASFLILQYGFQKLYNNQFHNNYYRDDTLTGSLTGFAVAWKFFSYSLYYTLIVGGLQVAGGTWLLFAKTRLIASVILLPVMVNIFFINQFYGVSADAYVNCLFILVTSLYILWLQREKILSLLFDKNYYLSPGKMIFIKTFLRVAVLVFAFMANYPYHLPNEGEYVTGKWKVVQLVKNGKPADLSQWQNNTNIWNNIYVETNGRLAFSANPFYYDYSKNRTINFNYKTSNNGLLLTRHAANATYEYIPVTIHRYNADSAQWNMLLSGDTMQMQLVKDTAERKIENKDLR